MYVPGLAHLVCIGNRLACVSRQDALEIKVDEPLVPMDIIVLLMGID